MTLEELQALLDEEKSKVSALMEEKKSLEEKIKGLEKENTDFKLENTQLRTTNGKLLLRIDDARTKDDNNNDDQPPKPFNEQVMDILSQTK